MPELAEVMIASVRKGTISDTDPTNVVLPTPKPPATTIFTDVVAVLPEMSGLGLELTKSTEHPFEQRQVRLPLVVAGLVNADKAFLRHVRYQHPRHPQRDREVG
jgi:hypothetical protein